MAYLNNIRFTHPATLPGTFPFTIPVIEALESLAFNTPVTFFVGDNGSGKSTLLAAIAVAMNCPALGARDSRIDPMLEAARKLADELTLSRSKAPKRRLFFRAEDALGFTRRLISEIDELADIEQHFADNLNGYGRDLAMGAVRGQRQSLESRYGTDPAERSHGEWFLHMLTERLLPNGFYLLDEPETPLSPIHQLSLISLLNELASENCQFIIATHSPILMALPGARILSFDQHIEEIAWDETDHVVLTRAFLADPERYLRHL